MDTPEREGSPSVAGDLEPQLIPACIEGVRFRASAFIKPAIQWQGGLHVGGMWPFIDGRRCGIRQASLRMEGSLFEISWMRSWYHYGTMRAARIL